MLQGGDKMHALHPAGTRPVRSMHHIAWAHRQLTRLACHETTTELTCRGERSALLHMRPPERFRLLPRLELVAASAKAGSGSRNMRHILWAPAILSLSLVTIL